MKQVFEDPVKGVEVMERMQLCHDLLTELRKQINVIEKDFFSLIGEEFCDLTVVSRRDRLQTIDGHETYIPAWSCHCTCGVEITIDHTDLIDKTTTNCGGDLHE